MLGADILAGGWCGKGGERKIGGNVYRMDGQMEG